MLLKFGVDISRLRPPIRKKLNLIENIVVQHSMKEAVVTSTYEGTHSPRSLHYANLAIDLRNPDKIQSILSDLKSRLGKDFDVVGEHDHIHIEYDPK